MRSVSPANRDINTTELLERLISHPLYDELRDEESLRIFMRSHVFCVWDFQCLLKALQRKVTCVDVPWLPTADPEARRMVNEIVLDEESDEAPGGGHLSHFELYLQAMEDCGADADIRGACIQRRCPWLMRVGPSAHRGGAMASEIPRHNREISRRTMSYINKPAVTDLCLRGTWCHDQNAWIAAAGCRVPMDT